MSGAHTKRARIAQEKRDTEKATGLLTCPKCGKQKPVAEFPQRGKHRHGDRRYGYCRPCHSEYQRINKLMRVYGLSVEEYEGLVKLHGNVCAICARPPKKMRLAIDHNHKNGDVRGLLWFIDNKVLGMIGDNPVRLRRAANYLEAEPFKKGSAVLGRITNRRSKAR